MSSPIPEELLLRRIVYLTGPAEFWVTFERDSQTQSEAQHKREGWSSAKVGVRTYLLGGAIDGSEANGLFTVPKRELVVKDLMWRWYATRRSCKVRVGSNGNLLWEASVLLGRKKGGLFGMCINYLEKSEIENSFMSMSQ
ncbi:hypothetical protein Tco_0705542 [Tanacetum coccineum]|uniref:Uncharacterized protein n=1 Tax=Tanacetum coccineum TaxID=301880 RepID=A0ABQ4Y514_9ASTR